MPVSSYPCQVIVNFIFVDQWLQSSISFLFAFPCLKVKLTSFHVFIGFFHPSLLFLKIIMLIFFIVISFAHLISGLLIYSYFLLVCHIFSLYLKLLRNLLWFLGFVSFLKEALSTLNLTYIILKTLSSNLKLYQS